VTAGRPTCDPDPVQVRDARPGDAEELVRVRALMFGDPPDPAMQHRAGRTALTP
jgi:hypothetical protein